MFSKEPSRDRATAMKIIMHLERTPLRYGSHLWSNTYERRTSDLFAVQTEVATAIAGNLKAAAGFARLSDIFRTPSRPIG